MDGQHPAPQKFSAGPAVHSALEGLAAFDLHLGLAVAPIELVCVPGGIDVTSYGSREALHSDDAGSARIIDLACQSRSVLASEIPRERLARLRIVAKFGEAGFKAFTFPGLAWGSGRDGVVSCGLF